MTKTKVSPLKLQGFKFLVSIYVEIVVLVLEVDFTKSAWLVVVE